MNFDQWSQLVKQSGANIDAAEPAWLQSQFGSGTSPALVSQAIKAGQFPRKMSPQHLPKAIITISPYDPRALKFPSDRTEWKWTTIISTGAMLSFWAYFCNTFRAYIQFSKHYPNARDEAGYYFIKDTWWVWIAIAALIIFIRRLFLYSPNKVWATGTYFGIVLPIAAVLYLVLA